MEVTPDVGKIWSFGFGALKAFFMSVPKIRIGINKNDYVHLEEVQSTGIFVVQRGKMPPRYSVPQFNFLLESTLIIGERLSNVKP